MPRPTPFHPRTSQLCTSLFYKEWAGYYTVRSYDTCHEREYFAIRHAAGLIDVTALYKYDVTGSDAAEFLTYVMSRDIRKLRPGRMTYLCWCDDDGKVVDDGTCGRLDENLYRVTAAEPTYSWFLRHSDGFDVDIRDRSRDVGALALQGPTSRDILRVASDADMDSLKFFGITAANIAGAGVMISRTGYTGDLGYEIWVEADDAVGVYDAIMEAGRAFRILPAGLDAMDVARVEAGFIMNGVDYYSAHQCPIESRKSSPYEIGLGWTVKLDREPFIGQAALRAEKRRGSPLSYVGLVCDWDQLERLCAAVGLPPQVHGGAWREPVPVYDAAGDRQVGKAMCGAWSPTLKKLLALASVDAGLAEPGTQLRIEHTVEYERHTIGAVVTPTPFFDPPRKRS